MSLRACSPPDVLTTITTKKNEREIENVNENESSV